MQCCRSLQVRLRPTSGTPQARAPPPARRAGHGSPSSPFHTPHRRPEGAAAPPAEDLDAVLAGWGEGATGPHRRSGAEQQGTVTETTPGTFHTPHRRPEGAAAPPAEDLDAVLAGWGEGATGPHRRSGAEQQGTVTETTPGTAPGALPSGCCGGSRAFKHRDVEWWQGCRKSVSEGDLRTDHTPGRRMKRALAPVPRECSWCLQHGGEGAVETGEVCGADLAACVPRMCRGLVEHQKPRRPRNRLAPDGPQRATRRRRASAFAEVDTSELPTPCNGDNGRRAAA